MSLPTLQTAPFLPFALPDIGEDEIAEVVDTMRSGWLTTGPKTRQFEQEFAAFAGPDVEAMAVNSATAGLHLALEAAGVQSGDEVITTTYTFTATAEVVRYLDAHPILVDIDPNTLNIDPKAIEKVITPRTKAIIPVHFGGLACDMKAILSIAKERGLKVIEDAAHSFPCAYQGTRIGALGSDAAVFSFYATKTLATGEGGMIVTRNPDLARRCRVMRLHGIDRDAFNRYRSEKPAWFYAVIAPGFKYNMPDLAAAIGLHQLRRGLALQAQRQRMAARYDTAFADLPLLLPPQAPPGDMHSWHLYVIRLTDDAPVSRDSFIERLAQRGIGTSVHFIPLHLHPYWQETYHLRPEAFPCAQRVFERCVSLPIYTRMTEEDQARVIDAVREILRG
jgi:dTDP-4-amino-4,6-dideoxygalactose transaminase